MQHRLIFICPDLFEIFLAFARDLPLELINLAEHKYQVCIDEFTLPVIQYLFESPEMLFRRLDLLQVYSRCYSLISAFSVFY